MNKEQLIEKIVAFFKAVISCALLVTCLCIFSAAANDATTSTEETRTQLGNDIESLKSEVLKLNRDLFVLEEDLLFPASTQVAVFVSVDVGRFFKIDSVEVKLNGDNVAGALYTKRQRAALERGGIQRLYLGNLKTGQHQLTAIVTGLDNEGRTVQRAANYQFEKDDEAVMLELKVVDSESSYRADVQIEQWVL
ncbi:AraC family transcriptional regulator [Shewanella sp. WXL01]|uniref:AraC family transcriptional regulator n=1 Tax=Shewanella sp. WXL01 TaxID=2709721 RepID=UPI001AEBDA18|nr:AraC family transcriptional regulator [Shewanella sp. WXL01]